MKKLFLLCWLAAALMLMSGCSRIFEASSIPEEDVKWDMIPCIMVDDTLYLTTGYKSSRQGDPAKYDGIISSEVPGYELPTQNDQSNFGSGYYYCYGQTAGTVDLFSNGDWWIYATEEVREAGTYKASANVGVNEAYQNIFSYYGVEHLHLDYRNFPDNFGGCYIENDTLQILLVSPTDDDLVLWKSICKTSSYEIQEVSYSIYALYTAEEALQNYNRDTPDSSPRYETFWNMDIKNNQITASILPEMEQDIFVLQQEHPCITYTILS